MKLSDHGLVELMDHEGIVLQPYRDSAGVWTIGVGHTAAAGPPDPAKGGLLTLAGAVALFRRDVARYAEEVDRAIRVPVAQHQFDAAVSFHFNTGAIARATWVKLLNAGDKARAAEYIMKWSKPTSIIPRRRAEQRLFRDGIYSSDGRVPVYAAKDGKVDWDSVRLMDVWKLLKDHPPAPPPEPQPEVSVSKAPWWAFFVELLRRIFT